MPALQEKQDRNGSFMNYPEFLDNSTFYHLDQSKSDIEQLLALAENIKRIHHLTAKHYESFEALIHDYLDSGIKIFQMQTGIVSHIIDDTRYIVKDVVTNLDAIRSGDEYELQGTYCREVALTKETLGFPHVGDMVELKEHPVYVNLKLEAYLSAPILVNDTLYGTLNFTSLKPRAHGFSEHEHDLITLMAGSIGNFIVLQEKEQNLKKVNFRMKELIGHVAHDLRNPIGAINSLSKMLLSRKMNETKTQNIYEAIFDESARSLELVSTILDKAALGTGKITLNKEVFEALGFVNENLERLSFLVSEQELRLEVSIPEGLLLFADKARLSQVFYNLLSNAFKYTPKQSAVSLVFVIKETFASCHISNRPSDTAPMLENSLYKSVGYGLDIVDDILNLHGTRREVFRDENTYCTSFDIPCGVSRSLS